MITLTAVIRCRAGSEELTKEALLTVAAYARDSEPGTAAYFVTRGNEAGIFVTHERYLDQMSLDAHNQGPAASAFFATTEEHIESVEVYIGREVFP
jgi:quinol monooxygenase YgiN